MDKFSRTYRLRFVQGRKPTRKLHSEQTEKKGNGKAVRQAGGHVSVRAFGKVHFRFSRPGSACRMQRRSSEFIGYAAARDRAGRAGAEKTACEHGSGIAFTDSITIIKSSDYDHGQHTERINSASIYHS
jgi:hypothetical protein